ncbi:MAG: glycerate kinase [Nocardiopsaceae bacterium]|nr:glycerate kinase [Nocardiopsaceae bacterium]
MGHVVIAPDKFKGSLTAAEVAAHAAAGLRRAAPGVETVELPVADGGEGTVDAAVAAGFTRVEAEVTGPVAGSRVTAAFGLRDGTAVIEAAQACGLSLLRSMAGGELAPLAATSRGVGELIARAASAGARRIVLGLGGVATNDGGAGMAQALGVRLLDDADAELPPGGAALARLARIALPDPAMLASSAAPPSPAPSSDAPPTAAPPSPIPDISALSGIEVLIASDVDNPLLGPNGAAAVYGPQKGASPGDVRILDAALARWADVAEEMADELTAPGAVARAREARVRDVPGAGAAGGLGFGALLFLRATPRPGIELLLDMLGFAGHLDGAALVITGEGSLDEQTLRGKAPAGVARAAAARRPPVPVVAVSGACSLSGTELRAAGISAAYALTSIEPDVTRCIAEAGPLTERLSARLAADWIR